MNLDMEIQDVYDWNLAFGHLTGDPETDAQRWMDVENQDLALDLIEEELSELEEAVYSGDKVATLDAICDIMVTVWGLAAKAGLNPYVAEAFSEVMRSNWSKADENGKPIYYENGKIAKSDRYTPPDLEKVMREVDEGL